MAITDLRLSCVYFLISGKCRGPRCAEISSGGGEERVGNAAVNYFKSECYILSFQIPKQVSLLYSL